MWLPDQCPSNACTPKCWPLLLRSSLLAQMARWTRDGCSFPLCPLSFDQAVIVPQWCCLWLKMQEALVLTLPWLCYSKHILRGIDVLYIRFFTSSSMKAFKKGPGYAKPNVLGHLRASSTSKTRHQSLLRNPAPLSSAAPSHIGAIYWF